MTAQEDVIESILHQTFVGEKAKFLKSRFSSDGEFLVMKVQLRYFYLKARIDFCYQPDLQRYAPIISLRCSMPQSVRCLVVCHVIDAMFV